MITVDPEFPVIGVRGGGRFLNPERAETMLETVPYQAIEDFLNAIGLNGTKGIVRVAIDPDRVDVTVRAESDLGGMPFVAHSEAQPNLLGGVAEFTCSLRIER